MASKRPELLICLKNNISVPLYQQLYEEVKNQIIKGNLEEGDKLPSIRSLCASLQISHATVERAYLQLSLEGYVVNKPRSGYVVSRVDVEYFAQKMQDSSSDFADVLQMIAQDPFLKECRDGAESRYDFAFTSLQAGSFPRKIWGKLHQEVFADIDESFLSGYRHDAEPDALQREMAAYLKRTRGVNCRPSQLVFQPGTEAALATIIQLLGDGARRIGHEEPGFEATTAVAQRFGAEMCSLKSDGTIADFLRDVEVSNPQVVFATPSHQFPTGKMMPLDARVRLLQWAERNNAYIVEDDACNEYRYDVQAVPSLQSLDKNNRVIYVGNFSKALSPGLRVAYIVLPPQLLALWYSRFTFSWDSLPYCQREVLARFVGRGYWDQQLRRMCTDNKRRHDTLARCLRREFGNRITISGIDSGMHLYVTVRNGMGQRQLLQSALAQGVNVYGTDRYFWSGRPHAENAVLIGFSAIALEDIPDGVKALRRAWFPFS